MLNISGIDFLVEIRCLGRHWMSYKLQGSRILNTDEIKDYLVCFAAHPTYTGVSLSG